jgi:beta-hydroxylase
MNLSILATAFVALYVAASIGYVYRWRGRARYPSFSHYLRRSWPLFAPLNCLLYLATRGYARQPVMDPAYLSGIAILRERWAQIRDEAFALHLAGEADAARKRPPVGRYDLPFRTFRKRGWKTFYLKWYGKPYRSARRLCPESVRLLEQVPGIRAAMFSVLSAGDELGLHADPLACSLRYHLGLETPNSDRCFINVDGTNLTWRDGEDFIVDGTYPHYARNGSDELRLILVCEVDRPMNLAGRAFSTVYGVVARAMAQPNTPEDRRGSFGWLSSLTAPWQAMAGKLKQRHGPAYLALKLSFDAAIVVSAFLLVYAAVTSMEGTAFAAIPSFYGGP